MSSCGCGRVVGDGDPVEGYVVDVGERWVLIAVLDASIFIDGFAAVPIADIARVEPRNGSREFVERALRLHDEWPPTSPAEKISLDDLGSFGPVWGSAVSDHHDSHRTSRPGRVLYRDSGQVRAPIASSA